MKRLSEAELQEILAKCPRVGTIWQHYKGGLYCVQGAAVAEAGHTPLVLYRRFKGWDAGIAVVDGPTFARPLQEWEEQVDFALSPYYRSRFTPIGVEGRGESESITTEDQS